MKNIFILIIVLSSITVNYAQQDIILTKYSFSSVFFNPATVGSSGEGEGTILANYRDQWLGLEGAPATLLLGGDINLAEDRLGAGLTIARENIGIDSRTDLLTHAAYRIHLDNDMVLSGGLRLGYHLFSSDFSKLDYVDITDPIYTDGSANFSVISMGVGLHFQSEKLYAGLSVPAIAAISSNERSGFKTRHFYFQTGALLGDEYSDFALEPSVLLKYQNAVPLQYTLGLTFWLKENLATGVFYRSENAIALSLEYILDDQLSMAVAYDITNNDLRDAASGTVELMVGYRLFRDRRNGSMGKSRRFRQ